MEIVTNIGQVSLTDNQILNYVPQGIWKRFSYIGGEVIGVSDIQPQQSDIDSLKEQLAALPDTIPQIVYINGFNVSLFQSDLFSILPSLSNFNLRLEFGALNTFATNKDFSGMSQYLGMLQNAGVATSDDVTAVKDLVNKQGVILA